MTIESFVAHYGIVAVFAGAALEGEAAVIASGLLAHQGLLPLPAVMAAAAIGSFAADQAWFALGRHFRDARPIARARARPAFARALGLLERHPIGFIFAFRFIYGFRTISPIAIGTSAVPARTFLAVNAVSAATWGIAFSLLGYLAGDAVERVLGRLHPHGTALWAIVGGVLLAGLALALVHWRRSRTA